MHKISVNFLSAPSLFILSLSDVCLAPWLWSMDVKITNKYLTCPLYANLDWSCTCLLKLSFWPHTDKDCYFYLSYGFVVLVANEFWYRVMNESLNNITYCQTLFINTEYYCCTISQILHLIVWYAAVMSGSCFWRLAACSVQECFVAVQYQFILEYF